MKDWKETLVACVGIVCIAVVLCAAMFAGYSCNKIDKEYHIKRLEMINR